MKKKGFTDRANLTKEQSEVYDLYINEHETPKRIALRRGTTVRAVYKTISKIRAKGINLGGFTKKRSTSSTPPTLRTPISNGIYIRLHGQEWNIKLIYKGEKYQRLRKKNILLLDGHTIRLYENSIEVYGNKSFQAEDEQQVERMSLNYWLPFFYKLEQALGTILIKEGHSNIKLVNSHYAQVNNELAKDYNKSKQKLRVRTLEDGKTWLEIDHSLNLNELEARHPETNKPDIAKVRTFFNDLRQGTPLLSELTGYIKEMAFHNKETAAGLNAVVKLMQPQEQEQEQVFSKPDYIG